VTTGLLRKYSSLLDVFLSKLLLRPGQALYYSPGIWQGVRAMRQHRSQWVW
jgi:hypothetical protein